MSTGGQDVRTGPMITGVPLIACNDRVGQLECWSGAAEGTVEDGGWCIVRSLVVGDRGACNFHRAIGMEDRSAVPARGRIAADGAVDDLEVTQRADAAANIVRNVAA